jgi:hypothetical protein
MGGADGEKKERKESASGSIYKVERLERVNTCFGPALPAPVLLRAAEYSKGHVYCSGGRMHL